MTIAFMLPGNGIDDIKIIKIEFHGTFITSFAIDILLTTSLPNNLVGCKCNVRHRVAHFQSSVFGISC